MDLSTLLSNIDSHKYLTVEDFLREVDLIWKNALEYNPDKDPSGDWGHFLGLISSHFDTQFIQIKSNQIKTLFMRHISYQEVTQCAVCLCANNSDGVFSYQIVWSAIAPVPWRMRCTPSSRTNWMKTLRRSVKKSSSRDTKEVLSLWVLS